ncbi:MAG TPA: hypothetical protein VHK01_11605 [Lacipirellulaceae bacterium]|nr:hypothetical protein [Lacipirellulaceae bacterium]
MFNLGVIELVLLVIVIAVIAAVSSKRPTMALGIAGLVFIGFMLLAVLIYFGRHVSAPAAAPPEAMWSPPGAPMAVSWQDNNFQPMTPNEMHFKAQIAIWPVLLLAGAVAAIVMFGLFRRSGGAACAAGHHRAWWPLALGLLFLPLGFLFVARTEVQQSAIVSNRFDAEMVEMRARQIHEQVARQQAELKRQQAELVHRTGELSSELQHRIENMEIHKLMDLVDAPRIILPIPTPATIAQWASAIAAEVEEEGSAEADSFDEKVAEHSEDDAVLEAEADAAVSVIAAQSDADVHEASASITGGQAVSVSSPVPPVTPNFDTKEGKRRTVTSSVAPERPGSRAPSKEPRPEWALQRPKQVGNVRRDVVTTDEYSSSDECYWAADRLLQLKTYEHLQRLVGTPYDADQLLKMRALVLNVEGQTPWFLAGLAKAGITVDYIRREIAQNEYLEESQRSFGPMLKLYTLIEFSPSVDNELRQRWEASQRQERFAFVGLGATGVLGLLGFAWGLLKIDTWTKGYYTKRLFIGVPLAILGTFGLYAWLAEMGFDLPH